MDVASQGSLSNEQLLEYIKKQKARIKRLEKENETLSKEKDSKCDDSPNPSDATQSNSLLFWPLISRAPPFQQKLAKIALQSFVYGLGQTSKEKTRRHFSRWKFSVIFLKSHHAEVIAEDAKGKTAELEQRVLKLKGLLAKTHHANQRANEDSNTYKRAQEEATQQFKSLKEKDDMEIERIMETLRVQSLESAFQYDMELVIQRAAEEMLTQQTQVVQSQSSGYSKKIKDVEEEKCQLIELVKTLEGQAHSLREAVNIKDQNLTTQKRLLADVNTKFLELQTAFDALNVKFDDEHLLRLDVEMELAATLTNRAEVIRNVESAADSKASKKLSDSVVEIADLKRQLERAERASRVLEADSEKLRDDLFALRNANDELASLKTEAIQLGELVTELKSELLRRDTQESRNHAALVKDPLAEVVQPAAPVEHKPMQLHSHLMPGDADELRQMLIFLTREVREHANQSRILVDLLSHHEHQVLKSLVDLQRLRNQGGSFTHRLLELIGRLFRGLFAGEGEGPQHCPLSVQKDALTKRRDETFQRLDQIKLGVNSFSSMVWEASSVVISAGRDICIPIPVGRRPINSKVDSATLEWVLLSEASNSAELFLSHPSDDPLHSSQPQLLLVSVHSYSDASSHEQRGSHIVPLHDETCYYSLRIQNSSMWGAITISYKIRLWADELEDTADVQSQLVRELEATDNRIARLQQLLDTGSSLLRTTEALSQQCQAADEEQCALLQIGVEKVSKKIEEDASEVLLLKQAVQTSLEGVSSLAEKMTQFFDAVTLGNGLVQKSCEDNVSANAGISGSQGGVVGGIGKAPVDASTQAESQPEDCAALTAPTAPTVYSSESIKIRASDDFRLTIPVAEIQRPFTMEWEFSLVDENKSATIGFALLQRFKDGTLPQVHPYRIVKVNGERGTLSVTESEATTHWFVLLFDNSFSWYQPKQIRYRVTISQLTPPQAVFVPQCSSPAIQDIIPELEKQCQVTEAVEEEEEKLDRIDDTVSNNLSHQPDVYPKFMEQMEIELCLGAELLPGLDQDLFVELFENVFSFFSENGEFLSMLTEESDLEIIK